ncbi:MAG: hypothetical protein WCG82_10205 [Bacteroidota bacterium]
MKLCKRCFKEFDDNEILDYDPAREFGDIFISDTGDMDPEDICPDCREEFGVMNLMGFRP